MLDGLNWLISTDNFMPHGHCFLWQPSTLWLNVGADALIAASYMAIPVAINVYIRKRQSEIRYAWMPLLFAAFIFLCGATHIMEIWTVWNPSYRVAGALKLITGIVSFATLGLLIRIMPHALLLKTPKQLHAEVDARTLELRDLNEKLRAEIAARDLVQRQLQVAEKERANTFALLQTIIESTPSLIYAKDLEGRMLLANPPTLALIGKSWAEVQGRTDDEFLNDPSQAAEIARNDRRLLESNRTESFEEAVGKQGADDRVWFSTKAPLRDASGTITGLVGVSVDITERKRLEHRMQLMVAELNHRVKNTLATVQAIATQTLRSLEPARYEGFQHRLIALACAHDVLTREQWSGAQLHDMARGQLIHVSGADGDRVELKGPEVRLSARASLALAMGLHELATNALKYGALSNDSGRIELAWEVSREHPATLRLTWTERGGPAVAKPASRGFGSRLIERVLFQDLGGRVELRFDDSQGLRCIIEVPLEQVSAETNLNPFPQVGSAFEAAR